MRAGDPVHVLEADRAGEAGTEHRHHRSRRVEPLDQVLHRLELRGARELDREPRAQVRVGLDDGDVEGRRARPARRPWRRTPRGLLALAAALAAPVVGRRRGRAAAGPGRACCHRCSALMICSASVLRHLEGEHTRVAPAPVRRPRRSTASAAGAAACWVVVDDPTASTFTFVEHVLTSRPVALGGRGRRRDVHVVTGSDLVGDTAVGVDGHRHRDEVLGCDRVRERAATDRPSPTRTSRW